MDNLLIIAMLLKHLLRAVLKSRYFTPVIKDCKYLEALLKMDQHPAILQEP